MIRLAIIKTIFILLLALLLPVNGFAHETGDTGSQIDINEQLGSYIPLDISFHNENGDTVVLKDLINKPTVIAPVYLSCTNSCPILLMGLADVVQKSKVQAGKDYRVLVISFDERDTPQLAAEKKKQYVTAAKIPVQKDDWMFLTGSADTIRKFTKSVGFQYRPEKEGFSHPVTLIFVASDGKIVRYLYGATFLPFEFEMAVTEASRGQVTSLAKKALLYCMSYDASQQRYVFNLLRVVATVMILTLVSFFLYLVISGRKYRKERKL
jgi:protein SCO1/2